MFANKNLKLNLFGSCQRGLHSNPALAFDYDVSIPSCAQYFASFARIISASRLFM